MMKILSTIVAVALTGPAAFADDSAAASDSKKAGAEATVAGEKAEKAGAKAEKAGDRAMDAHHQKYAKHDEPALKQAHSTIGELQRTDPGFAQLCESAAGYAVFSTVGKGAVGVGGARGTGVLFEKGAAVGEATLTQLTVGLQLGAQTYSEIIYFETEKSLAAFKKGEFAMAAQVSAVAATTGASANAKYTEGVSVFTLTKAGVMAEASVGGQKFGYRPFEKAIVTSNQ